jgi:3-hydroxybutyryl-CoA dehydrogenase
MRICVLADDLLKSEFLQKGIPDDVEVIWADTFKALYSISDIDVYFDLLFKMDKERIDRLCKLKEKTIFINAVNDALADSNGSFIRINAWPTMLKRSITELAIHEQSQESAISAIFKKLQWNHQLVPDIPGMITPRVIAMIINEAYYTLEQKVSTKDEIDVAMKLGTNYPMGPFEWSEKIGLKRIYSLLNTLSYTEKRYLPSTLLKQEAELSE